MAEIEEMMKQNAYYYFLQSVPGIGNTTIRNLLKRFQAVDMVYQAPEAELAKCLTKAQLDSFLKRREEHNPFMELQKLEREGRQYYSIADEQYPGRLRRIPDAPYGIFVKGTLSPDKKRMAAVIGTRNHSGYGESMAKEYGRILALCQIGVVSGMARGIDGIAQWSAMNQKGDTYGVLGCGVDVCYPPENRALYERIPAQGALISEYMPNTQPRAGLFPRRNRIISGLSDLILVIEAREKSGTLITVDMALEQGKEVYALPGRVTDTLSVGCNHLIAQGAYILPEPDVFYQQLQECMGSEQGGGKLLQKTPALTSLEQAVYQILDVNPMTTDAIYSRLQHSAINLEKEQYHIQDVNVSLITLSMKKLVRQVNGTMFMKGE